MEGAYEGLPTCKIWNSILNSVLSLDINTKEYIWLI